MSIPNLRAIRDWCKEKITGVEKSLVINGVQLYLDYQNGAYGINTDPERGPDTFTPFMTSAEGGGGGTTPSEPDEPVTPPQEEEEVKQIIDFKYGGGLGQTYSSKFTFNVGDFDVNKLIKFVINNFTCKGLKNTSNAYTVYVYFQLYVSVNGAVKAISLGAGTVSTTTLKDVISISNKEYTLAELNTLAGGTIEKISHFYCYTSTAGTAPGNISVINELSLDAEIQYSV